GISNTSAHINNVYNHDYVITLDEIGRIDEIITHTVEEAGKDIQVYSNPSHQRISVKLPSQGFFKLEIRNMQGAQLYEKTIGSTETSFDLNSGLPPGLYFLMLYKGRHVFKKKVIIY
ncbi:MAG TPA: T9SS type A sorting domain-containing protein, partial [Chryseosolibacter sp.]